MNQRDWWNTVVGWIFNFFAVIFLCFGWVLSLFKKVIFDIGGKIYSHLTTFVAVVVVAILIGMIFK